MDNRDDRVKKKQKVLHSQLQEIKKDKPRESKIWRRGRKVKAKAEPQECEDQLFNIRVMDRPEMRESFQAAHSWAGGVCTSSDTLKERSVCTGPHRACVQLQKSQALGLTDALRWKISEVLF